MSMYSHKDIEPKWQKYWQEKEVFATPNNTDKPKYYVLDMFPYPSGAGLHVGHPEGYTANDIVARYKHACGFNVLHPMGWDAFGLPAENYAIKTGTHPRITTAQNIATFKRQIQALGFSYDWNREIDTTDPKYFKWTQWIFLKLFEAGLAYEQDLPINYCPSCKTGLANEEVVQGRCERCDNLVEKKKIRQWVLAITKYAKRLEADVEKLDWPKGIKDMQINWIGKSQGCEFEMQVVNNEKRVLGAIRVYTTRIDTVFGMTYAVIAPDHKDVVLFIAQSQLSKCQEYIQTAKNKADQERTAENKEKTGVFTGNYVVNPFNGEAVPLWIADYVLGNYGTGAVMAVPGHDSRDGEFAQRFGLPIKKVIAPYLRLTGESIPKDGIETRTKTCVTAFIRHPNEEKYLVEVFENGEICFLGGGVDAGESPEIAMKREIQEESGCSDISSCTEVGIFIGHGYKARKNINCKDKEYSFVVQLGSLEGFQERAQEDSVPYTNEWWTTQQILESKEFKSHHKEIFLDYINNVGPFIEDGILMNCGEYDMMSSQEARIAFTNFLQSKGIGESKTNYKLRDWLFSRQRYWGEPIPLIHLEIEQVKNLPHIDDISQATDKTIAYILKREANSGEDVRICGCHGKVRELIIDGKVFSKIYDGIYTKIVCDYRLPLNLPEVERYEPAGDGNSPLATVESFVNIQLAQNLSGKRETNTMPQWGGSCWYYLRFMDSKNPDQLVAPEIEKYWGSVDSYVGGAEHAVLHLLYARFWHKFLFDIGVLSTDEPFYRLRNQGMILGMSYKDAKGKLIASDLVEEKDGKFYSKETGEELSQMPAKMSKSLKNVINPDDVVQEYGADTLRLYEMYMGDFKDTKPWDTKAIIGVRRFLEKVWRLYEPTPNVIAQDDHQAMKILHKTLKKVGEDIEEYRFNTAIAQMMICVNYGLPKDGEKAKEWKETFVQILHPFAPHIAEELWEMLGKNQSIFQSLWPKYDENLVVDDTMTLAVQVNGKVRGDITIGVQEDISEVLAKAKSLESVQKWIQGKEIVKEIYVPGRILNIVVK